MALDLGTMLGQLAGQYISSRYATPAPQQIFSGGNLPVLAGSGGLPPVVIDQGGGYCSTEPPKGMRWSASKGMWVKKSRRRRKRLATASDLSDLAALKGVLGGGAAFTTWIATHS